MNADEKPQVSADGRRKNADERHISSVRLITHEINEKNNDYKTRKKNHKSARWQNL